MIMVSSKQNLKNFYQTKCLLAGPLCLDNTLSMLNSMISNKNITEIGGVAYSVYFSTFPMPKPSWIAF